MIDVKQLTKVFTIGEVNQYALNQVNLSIKSGEFVVLLGPSGSGKSTLLNVISGLEKETSGTVTINEVLFSGLSQEEKVEFRRNHVGFVFQEYHLLPTLTVKENIELGAQLNRDSYPIYDIASDLHIENHLDKYPHQLSGGEQQRVSIARAIIKKPSILFCDEPTGALDEQTSKDVLELLHHINKTYNTTILLITHNPLISLLGDKVIELNSGEVKSIKDQNRKSVKEIEWS